MWSRLDTGEPVNKGALLHDQGGLSEQAEAEAHASAGTELQGRAFWAEGTDRKGPELGRAVAHSGHGWSPRCLLWLPWKAGADEDTGTRYCALLHRELAGSSCFAGGSPQSLFVVVTVATVACTWAALARSRRWEGPVSCFWPPRRPSCVTLDVGLGTLTGRASPSSPPPHQHCSHRQGD